MNKTPPPADYDDNPEWTKEDFARARPASELHSPHVVAALVRRGRPVGTTKPDAKRLVSLRLDREVVDKFKAGGPGWQTRINETLRRAKVG